MYQYTPLTEKVGRRAPTWRAIIWREIDFGACLSRPWTCAVRAAAWTPLGLRRVVVAPVQPVQYRVGPNQAGHISDERAEQKLDTLHLRGLSAVRHDVETKAQAMGHPLDAGRDASLTFRCGPVTTFLWLQKGV